jgi:2-polyprenyl-3-methyl-5-hydroxy-6-metoxy-1,4-benzoquinol methylase
MSEPIPQAEVQLCLSAKNYRKPAFVYAELRGFGEMVFKDQLEDWADAWQRLCQQGVFGHEGEKYALTESGAAYVERIVTNEFFGRMLVRAEQSQAFGRYCERVYGKNLTQFGTADMSQLEKLLAVLGLNQHSRVLDVCCGIGTTAEYISDVTGARITGIDLAEPAIERARKRTKAKAERLSFVVMDVNHIAFPPDSFDTVIAVDTLYFAKDLDRTVGELKAALQPNGQMGLFWSQWITPDDPVEQLAAGQTKLARALQAHVLKFEASDLTASDLAFWERSQAALAEMQPEFEAEGNKDLCEGRLSEGSGVMAMVKAGRMSRYLYRTHSA